MKGLAISPTAQRLHWTRVERPEPYDVLDARCVPDWHVTYELGTRRGVCFVRRAVRLGVHETNVFETPPGPEPAVFLMWQAVVDGRAV
ncbi:hypothetical protein [Spirillospora sp. NPDC047279]|uniref:hypothetical protein n=1 Tax=Spirillospora sp. NPDC047279 TaxID=3155478 RepID=UPI0033C2C3E5